MTKENRNPAMATTSTAWNMPQTVLAVSLYFAFFDNQNSAKPRSKAAIGRDYLPLINAQGDDRSGKPRMVKGQPVARSDWYNHKMQNISAVLHDIGAPEFYVQGFRPLENTAQQLADPLADPFLWRAVESEVIRRRAAASMAVTA